MLQIEQLCFFCIITFMFTILLIFIVASAVSFVGSLQLGPVNLYVINTVLHQSKKSAVWVAIGGCLPEFIYCALAVYASSFLNENKLLQQLFSIIFIVVLLCVGIILMLKKKKNNSLETVVFTAPQSAIKSMVKGFSLAALNPQLFPFWIFVQVYFNSITALQLTSKTANIAYIVGAGIGDLVLLLCLIAIVQQYKAKFIHYINHKYYYKALGILFWGIAVQQLLLLNK